MEISRELWLTEFEFIDLLEERRGDRSVRSFAEELEVSNQFLGQVLGRVKPPGEKIPEAAGYEAVTLYRPINTDHKKARSK